jgi:hypothetical protein
MRPLGTVEPMFDAADPIASAAAAAHGRTAPGRTAPASPPAAPAVATAIALVQRADELHAAIGRATRALLSTLIEIDRTGAWQHDGARDATHWVQMRYGVSTWKAHRWLVAASALESLPHLSDALVSGELGMDKVVELARYATPETERGLIAWATSVSPGAIRRRAELESRRSPEAVAAQDDERRLRWWLTDEGRRMELMAELPAADGAVVAAAIERVADALPEIPGEDRRTSLEARRADALVALCCGGSRFERRGELAPAAPSARAAQERSPERSRARRVRPRIVVHVPIDAFRNGDAADASRAEIHVNGAPSIDAGVIDGPILRRLACDAELQALIEDRRGEPLHLGRVRREPTAEIVRVVRQRDRECRFPGCGARRFTEAHHIVWWARGGATDVDNLVLLCGFHHRLVHEHGWSIDRSGGDVRWRRPDGLPYLAGPSPPS